MDGSFLVRRSPAPSLERFGSHRLCSTPRNFRNDSPRTATPGLAFTVQTFRPSNNTVSDTGRMRRCLAKRPPQRLGGFENSFLMASTFDSTSSTSSWLIGVPSNASIRAAILIFEANIRAIFPRTQRGEREIHGCMKIWPCFGGAVPLRK